MPTMIYVGDCKDVLPTLPANSVQCVVTSPPYWGLRDYGLGSKALGLEPTPELYVEHLVEIFRDVKRVLHPSGTVWCNLGDSYATGSKGTADGMTPQDWTENGKLKKGGMTRAGCPDGLKPKDLCGIPWRAAFALQADGWWLRSDIIWHKPNCMPESVTDRPTKAHEYVFLLTKSARYYYDAEAIKEDCSPNTHSRGPEYHKMNKTVAARQGIRQNESWEAATWGPVTSRNRRTVWTMAENQHPLLAYLLANLASDNPEYLDALLDQYGDDITLKKDIWTVPTQPYSGAHFATFAPALVEPMVKAGTSERGCCAACGAPWERVTEVTGETNRQAAERMGFSEKNPGNQGINKAGGHGNNSQRQRTTIGWQPTCTCGVDVDSGALDPNTGAGIDVRQPFEPVPCTVLDIFAGAGTVGLVADRLQRNAILIELNPEYAEMARRRIEDEAPMFTSVQMESRQEG